jgi:adenine-specific DNA methylase
MIEENFDVSFVAELAIREKQIQQNYRPIIAVHKWFARRPGTLFRGLLLAEFLKMPLRESFYRAHQLTGIRVADPFMGGGTPLLEANRLGCDVVGYDINPMAYWIVRQEIEHLDLAAYRKAANELRCQLERKVGHLYTTRCEKCSNCAHAKYFLWVKTIPCDTCGRTLDLFPGYLLAEDVRHPTNVIVCGKCGALNERKETSRPGKCSSCDAALSVQGVARRNRCKCPDCKTETQYPQPEQGPLAHRMFAIEYHCPACKAAHQGRFFKKPDAEDLAKAAEARATLEQMRPKYIPDDAIPPGDESSRLHRWGYRRYRELFSDRQLLGLELSGRLIAEHAEGRIRQALATNLSDLLRYQNMLCRYDTMALKSLDIFSVHGFPVGLIECESNLLGISGNAGPSVGSGGWSNIIDKFEKAKAFCDDPFEVRNGGGRKTKIPTRGEWIGEKRAGVSPETRQVHLRCADASKAHLAPHSLDAVFTDPPYYGSVQYAELMDFCYVWLRRLVSPHEVTFQAASTRHASELTENDDMNRGLAHFAEGLAAVFARMAAALKPNAPLVFTYHHNKLRAYAPVALAILDAGLIVSASIPCPAEMEASIHINGTGSSIVDTVFVCRAQSVKLSQRIPEGADDVAGFVAADVSALRDAGVETSDGDTRCIAYGHLVRRAVGKLRDRWERSISTQEKLTLVELHLGEISLDSVTARVTEAATGEAERTSGTLFDKEGLSNASSISV